MKPLGQRFVFSALAAGALLWSNTHLAAQTIFTNKATGKWSVDSSWQSNSKPATSGAAEYEIICRAAATLNTTNDLGSPNFALNRLTFAMTQAGVNLRGNPLVFQSTSNGSPPQILHIGTGTANVYNDIQLTTNTSVSSLSNNIILRGKISGSGSLRKTNINRVFLTASNSYSGQTIVQRGTLVMSNTTGTCVTSPVLVTSSGTDTTYTTLLELGRAEQIDDNATVSIINNHASKATVRFNLQGYNETIGGLINTNASTQGLVAAAPDTTVNKPATLTLNLTSGKTCRFGPLAGGGLKDGGAGSQLTLVKTGPGTQILAGTNIFYTGPTTNSEGMLRLSNTTAFASSVIVNHSTLVFDLVSTNYICPVYITGSGTVIKEGNGTLELSSSNSFTGPTLINAGKIVLTAAKEGAGQIVLSDGAQLEVKLPYPNAILAASEMTLGNAGNATVDVNLGAYGNPSNPVVQIAGNLLVNSSITVNLSGVGLAQGSITLFKYDSLTGSGRFQLGTMPAKVSGLIVTNATNHSIDLQVTVQTLTWTGEKNSQWDIDDGSGSNGTLNWLNPEGIPTPYRESPMPGDLVTFNDTASNTTVSLSRFVSPAFISVSNNTKDYLFNGDGMITGSTGLYKNGAGKLTINTFNDYSGATYLNGGTLSIPYLANTGFASSVGAPSAAPDNLVFNGGTLQYSGASIITERGAKLYSGGGTLEIASPDCILTLNGVIAGDAGGTLTKSGPGQLILAGANTFKGPVFVTGGVLQTDANSALGATNSGTWIAESATLDLNGKNLGAEAITVQGAGAGGYGAIINSGSLQTNALRQVTLSGNATFGGVSRWDMRNNPTASLTGNGFNLTKINTNEVWLANVGDTALGEIVVAEGTLGLAGTTTLGNSTKALTLASQTTLILWNHYASNVLNKVVYATNAIIQNGSGSNRLAGPLEVSGNCTVNVANGELVLASQVTGQGSLTKTGTGTLQLQNSANRWSGGTTNLMGLIAVSASGALPADILNEATLSLAATSSVNTLTYAGQVFGSGTLLIPTNSSGIIILEGNISNSLVVKGGITLVRSDGCINNSVTVGAATLVLSSGTTLNAGSLDIGLGATNSQVVVMTHNPTATNLVQACQIKIGGSGTNVTSGILTLSNGAFNVSGPVILAAVSGTDGPATGTVNLCGGWFNLAGDILGCASNNSASSLILAGATLDLWPAGDTNGTGQIGTAMDPVKNLILLAGTLKNLGEFNGGSNLVKTGSGTLNLAGTNTYRGMTVVRDGLLLVDGVLGTNVMAVEAGTLGGSGTINGPTIIQSGGGLAPGGALGQLRINGPLTLAGVTIMEISKAEGVALSDLVWGLPSVTYGGSLLVTNIGEIAPRFNDCFWLFDSAAYAGFFTSFQLPPLTNTLRWNVAELTNSGTLVVAQNHFPVANSDLLSTLQNQPATVATSLLLSNDTDADGDPLQVTACSPMSLQGGLLNWETNRLIYMPPTDFTGLDSFTYTLIDTCGAVATGLVQVAVTNAFSVPFLLSSGTDPSKTTFKARFTALPGKSYAVQTATNLNGPWGFFAQQVGSTNGWLEFTATNDSTLPQRFFKISTP